jgi:hypothetical protein
MQKDKPGGMFCDRNRLGYMQADADLHCADYCAWITAQAALLPEGRLRDIDAKQLAQALEIMRRRERDELVSRPISLIAHLFKRQYQPARRPSGWRGSVVEQRV